MESKPLAFGSWLQGEMDVRELSQGDLHRATGASRGLISQWLSGAKVPSSTSCKKIAAALRLPEGVVLFHAGHIDELPSPVLHYELERQLDQMSDQLRLLSGQVRGVAGVPLRVIGRVPADSLRPTEIEPYEISIPEGWIAGAHSPMGLEVTGDCMRSLGILPGDVLICDRAMGRKPSDGQLVVIRVGDEVTFKRWCVAGRHWELRDGDGTVVRTLTVMDDFEVLAFYLRFDPRASR